MKSNDYFTKNDINKNFEDSTESYFNTKSKFKQDLDMNKDDNFKVTSSKSRDCQNDKDLIATSCLCMLL